MSVSDVGREVGDEEADVAQVIHEGLGVVDAHALLVSAESVQSGHDDVGDCCRRHFKAVKNAINLNL